MRKVSFVFAAALALALASVAVASVSSDPIEIATVRSEQTRLQAEVRAGKGAFKDLSKSERESLVSKQDRLLQLLQGKETHDQLSQDERLEVFNTLEEIRAAITHAEDERKVCRREKTVTSNVPKMVCMTARQEREQRERARDMLQRSTKCADASCLSSGG